MSFNPSNPVAQPRGLVLSLIAIGFVFVVGVGYSVMMPLVNLRMNLDGATPAEISWHIIIANIPALIISLFLGRLIHLFGTAALSSLCMTLMILGTIGFLVSDNHWFWLFDRMLLLACISVLFGTSEFWINSVSDPAKRGVTIGIYTATFSFSFALGPTMLSFFGSQSQVPFLITLIFFLLAMPLNLFAPRKDHFRNDEEDGVHELSFSALINLLKLAPILLAGITVFAVIETTVLNFSHLWGLGIGMAESQSYLVITSYLVGGIIAQPFLGYLSDRIGRRKVFLLVVVMAAVSAFLLPFASSNLGLVYFVALLLGIATSGIYTVVLTVAGDRFTGHRLANFNGAIVFAYNVGAVFLIYPSGYALTTWPVFGMPLVLVLILTFLGGLFFLRHRWNKLSEFE